MTNDGTVVDMVDLRERRDRRTASFTAAFPEQADRALIEIHQFMPQVDSDPGAWCEYHTGDERDYVADLQDRYVAWEREFDAAEAERTETVVLP